MRILSTVFFVYRSHYESLLSKRVVRLRDATVLDWFRRGWHADDPEEFVDSELGDVYGLESIFEAAAEHELPAPETWQELYLLLHKHLWVEGDPVTFIRFDGHSLRVRTDDDEVDLAYMFVDDTAASARSRWAYPLHESWPLPTDVTEGTRPFSPDVAPHLTAVDTGGEGTTWAVLLTFDEGSSFDGPRAVAFAGVRLSGLTDLLMLASADDAATWPPEMELLRRQVAAGAQSIEAAMQGANRSADVRPAGNTGWRDPDRTALRVDAHIAQMAMHRSDFFGHQQWFLFDDVWAASHPDLAESLLRYAAHWDPEHEVVPTPPDTAGPLRDAVASLRAAFGERPADDPRHGVPAMLEAAVAGRAEVPTEVCYGRCAETDAGSWSAREVAAVRAFAGAHWNAALHGQTADDAGSVLAGIMLIEPDVVPYLLAWQAVDTVDGLQRLVDFYDANQASIIEHGRLANPYLRGRCPVGQRQVIGWLCGEDLYLLSYQENAETAAVRELISNRHRALRTSISED